MKIMSRNFTLREKVLLVLLAVILIGLVYYKFVYQYVSESIASSNAEAQSLQTELEVVQARVQKIKEMEAEIESVTSSGKGTQMASYNNSKWETAFLHTVLSGVPDYTINFAEVTRNGDQIRRSFTLLFRTSNYQSAEAIVRELSSSDYRCLIEDIDCSIGDTGETTVSLTAVFFETMAGGVPDSGLPRDEETVNQ